jgi:asparagine synthetase B (glutamine-hydrolysing)
MIDFLISVNKEKIQLSLSGIFINKPPIKLSYNDKEIEFVAWGDPIYDQLFIPGLLKQPLVSFIINNLYGHYYYLLLNKRGNTIFIGNSLFSILPVYFSETNDCIDISNDPFSIQNKGKSNKYNKRFLLENILFNYPLFDQSCIINVSLLPSNSNLIINNRKASVTKHTDIIKYFSLSPVSWQKSTDAISDLFIDASGKYFPDEPYASSLTGGFDGRTLVACGLYRKKKFITYCFGTETSDDIQIAESLSNKIGLEFNKISLDKNYVNNYSQSEGLDFIRGSLGSASFARAHYLYATKELSEKTNYLITGNFGSEVFRTAHNAGSVISKSLHTLFNNKDYDSSIKELETCAAWNWLNRDEFKNEWESLKEELRTLPCFKPEYKLLSKNQQFYITVFEEVFRKYFGAEMVNQFYFLSNRTPFLDIDFLKGILGTNLAGVHSDFFTNNALKRFKGQVLYAHIIKKTYPDFGKILTDKGYAPIDLLSYAGKLRIAESFLFKKIKQRKRPELDPYAVNLSFKANKFFWEKLDIDPVIFNASWVNKSVNGTYKKDDSMFIMMSQAYFYKLNFSAVSKVVNNSNNIHFQ